MIKTRFKIIIFLLLILLFSCNKAEKETFAKSETILKKEIAILSPDDIDTNKIFSVEILSRLVFQWQKVKNITLSGYIKTDSNKANITKTLELIPFPDYQGNKKMICNLVANYRLKINPNKPVTISGKIISEHNGIFILDKCEIVRTGYLPEKTGYIPFPKYFGVDISLSDFYKSYFGWYNKKVTVFGNFIANNKDAGIELISDLSQLGVVCKLKNNRKNINQINKSLKIKGVIKGKILDKLILENCEILDKQIINH